MTTHFCLGPSDHETRSLKFRNQFQNRAHCQILNDQLARLKYSKFNCGRQGSGKCTALTVVKDNKLPQLEFQLRHFIQNLAVSSVLNCTEFKT